MPRKNHKDLNPRRFITSEAQAEEVRKAQAGTHKLADNLQIALAEVEPSQKTKKVSTIDIGVFDITDASTFNQIWNDIS